MTLRNTALPPLLALTLVLSACTRMQPVELPTEDAAAAATADLWSALAPAIDDDWHVLLNRGPVALDRRLLAIDSATRTIDLQTFLLQPDAVGTAVLEHLIVAADRGVRVRFLIDDSFLYGEDELIMSMHRHENIRFRVFNPYRRRSDDALTRELLNLGEFERLDHRMHNKAMIIDGRVAIVGGRNLADEYFGLHAEANFRDLEVMVGGSIVRDISRAFADYWNDDWAIPIEQVAHVQVRHLSRELLGKYSGAALALHSEPAPGGLTAIWKRVLESAVPARTRLLVDRPPRDNPALAQDAPVQVAAALMDLVDRASEEVIIVSAYLIPTPVLEDAVQRAEARGVEVRVLTNSIASNNHLIAHSAYRNHINALLGHGAELFEVRTDARERPLYIRSPVADKVLALHAKALLIDRDRVFIGSANLDPRSLRINTEMGLLIESEAFNAAVRDAVAVDFDAGNAWKLRYDEAGRVLWVSGDLVLTAQPATSALQRLEDWFFAHLPLEDEL